MAVTDPSGNMIAFARMDGAPLGATELAVNKAHTAALWQMSSGEVQRSMCCPHAAMRACSVAAGAMRASVSLMRRP